MSEVLNQPIEVPIPDEINREWLKRFNEEYGGGEFLATVKVEDWLEEPRDEPNIGSGYFTLEDEMGPDGWWQTISGKIHSADLTNVPGVYSDGTRFTNVLALTDAIVQKPEGSRPLAGGSLVLVRLDRLKANPVIAEI